MKGVVGWSGMMCAMFENEADKRGRDQRRCQRERQRIRWRYFTDQADNTHLMMLEIGIERSRTETRKDEGAQAILTSLCGIYTSSVA
jgi:hypothetical protein